MQQTLADRYLSSEETLAIAQDTLPNSVINKMIMVACDYMLDAPQTEAHRYAVALSAGNILKQLGQPYYATGQGIGEILDKMDQIDGGLEQTHNSIDQKYINTVICKIINEIIVLNSNLKIHQPNDHQIIFYSNSIYNPLVTIDIYLYAPANERHALISMNGDFLMKHIPTLTSQQIQAFAHRIFKDYVISAGISLQGNPYVTQADFDITINPNLKL